MEEVPDSAVSDDNVIQTSKNIIEPGEGDDIETENNSPNLEEVE